MVTSPPPSQSAVGWEYQAQLSKHESQTDAVKGFGGKFGVQKDRVDQVSQCGRCARWGGGQCARWEVSVSGEGERIVDVQSG